MTDLGSVPPEAGHSRPEHDPVPLDRDALKLLASDTRLDILKTLKHRRMTVSELAATLKLGKSTVFEHVSKLAEGGLVIRHDDPGREWVYYELSGKAKRLLQPSTARVVLLFGSVLALAAAAVAAYVVFQSASFSGEPASSSADALQAEAALAGAPDALTFQLTSADGAPASGEYRLYVLDEAGLQHYRSTGEVPAASVEKSKASDGSADGAPASSPSPPQSSEPDADYSYDDGATAGSPPPPPAATSAPPADSRDEGSTVAVANATAEDGNVTVDDPLPPGTHYVLAVRSDADAASTVVRVDVEPARLEMALSPLLVGADDGRPIPFTLTFQGSGVSNATFAVAGAAVASPANASTDEAGRGVLNLTLRSVGDLALRYRVASGFPVAPEGEVAVVRPQVVVDTLHPAAGANASLAVTVFEASRGPVEGARVRLLLQNASAPPVAAAVTGADGRARLAFDAAPHVPLDVFVGETRFATVTPLPGLRLEGEEDGNVTRGVRVALPEGAPVANASVFADGELVGVTGEDGRVESGAFANATRLQATKPLHLDAFAVVARAPTPTEGHVLVPRTTTPSNASWSNLSGSTANWSVGELVLDRAAESRKITAGEHVLVSVPVRVLGPNPGPVDVTLFVNGVAVETQRAALAEGEARAVTFTGTPDVGVHDYVARAEDPSVAFAAVRVEVVAPPVVPAPDREAQSPEAPQGGSTEPAAVSAPWAALAAAALAAAAFAAPSGRRRRR